MRIINHPELRRITLVDLIAGGHFRNHDICVLPITEYSPYCFRSLKCRCGPPLTTDFAEVPLIEHITELRLSPTCTVASIYYSGACPKCGVIYCHWGDPIFAAAAGDTVPREPFTVRKTSVLDKCAHLFNSHQGISMADVPPADGSAIGKWIHDTLKAQIKSPSAPHTPHTP